MKQSYIVLFLCFFTLNLYSQHSTPKDRYYIDVSVGPEATVLKPSNSNLAGFLLNSQSREASFHIRYQHFFNQKWGLFAAVHFHNRSSYDAEDLPEGVTPDWRNYYLINDYYENNDGGSQTYLFGPQYRFESKHFSIRPYLGFGWSHIETCSFAYEYKGRGNNEVYRSEYGFKDNSLSSFCFSPGVNIVWKVSDQIHFFADVNYIQNVGSHEAAYSVIDMYNGKYIKEESQKATPPSLLSMKVGISLPLYFNKKKK